MDSLQKAVECRQMTELFWYLLLIVPIILAVSWPWIVEWYLGGQWRFDFE